MSENRSQYDIIIATLIKMGWRPPQPNGINVADTKEPSCQYSAKPPCTTHPYPECARCGGPTTMHVCRKEAGKI